MERLATVGLLGLFTAIAGAAAYVLPAPHIWPGEEGMRFIAVLPALCGVLAGKRYYGSGQNVPWRVAISAFVSGVLAVLLYFGLYYRWESPPALAVLLQPIFYAISFGILFFCLAALGFRFKDGKDED